MSTKKRPRQDSTAVLSEEDCFSLEWTVSEQQQLLTIHQSAVLCLTGRGTMKLEPSASDLEDSSSITPSVAIMGYRLTDKAIGFDSPSWGRSWVTLECQGAVKLSLRAEATIHVWNAHQDPKARPVVAPSLWNTVMDDILQDYHAYEITQNRQSALFRESLDDVETHEQQRRGFHVAACGAKHVGKSTFLMLLANRMLSTNGIERIAWLDIDCGGQGEFGLPGMLALTIITEPIIIPPHRHQQKPQEQYAIFWGTTTSQTNPVKYMEYVKDLMQNYSNLEGPLPPLLINCDGWVKGLGEQVLQALVQEILPTHVVILQGDTKSQHVSLTCPAEATMHTAYAFHSSQHHPPNYRSDVRLSADVLRHVRIISYVLPDPTLWDRVNVLPNGIDDSECEIARQLSAQLPYVVPIIGDNIALTFAEGVHGGDIQTEEARYRAFNGSIVGLVCDSEEAETGHIPRCIGLGLIRGIDLQRRWLYVLSPVAQESLRNVNRLVRGSIDLPLECWFRGVEAESFPHLAIEVKRGPKVLGRDPMKSRNSIARRSQLAANSKSH